MLRNRKYGGSLLLAGVAAFVYYKYSKMSAEEKSNLVGKVKEKGKKLFDQFMPSNLKETFATEQAATVNNKFGEGNNFTG